MTRRPRDPDDRGAPVPGRRPRGGRAAALAAFGALGALLALGCGGSDAEGVPVAPPAADAVALVLRAEQATDPDDRTVVLPAPHPLRVRAYVVDRAAPAGVRAVVARWQSPDASVVRIDAADSVATLTPLAPGSATITATDDGGGATRRATVRLGVVAGAP